MKTSIAFDYLDDTTLYLQMTLHFLESFSFSDGIFLGLRISFADVCCGKVINKIKKGDISVW